MEKVIIAKTASKGVVIGKTYLYDNKLHIDDVKGRILVLEFLTPDILIYLEHIKGVIAKYGGVTSHPAIVCRESKIPFVVDFAEDFDYFKKSRQVELNATEGFVKILC